LKSGWWMVEEMLYIYIVLNSFIKIDNHPYYYCNLFIAWTK
jgi:hypothetical protein